VYYRSVNRGLSFTKAGIYTVLFIFGIGMVAINTGVNAAFLFLSLGMALLIVSGLLSEKAMRHYEARHFNPARIDAQAPFTIEVAASNSSPTLALYGMENVLLAGDPKFGRLRTKIAPLGRGSILRLPPRTNKTVEIHCNGVRRGVYESFTLMQQTNFPFGLLDKFKIGKITGELVALPASDARLAAALRTEYRRRVAQTDDDKEFFTHRNWQPGFSARDIDWRKSGGRPERQWVMREYRSTAAEFGILIETDWQELLVANTESEYEAHLSALRTATEVVAEGSRHCMLRISNNVFVPGSVAILTWIAGLPEFAARSQQLPSLPKDTGTNTIQGRWIRLHVTARTHAWDDRATAITIGRTGT